MDENLKYFKLSGGDIGDKHVVVACKPEQEDAMRQKFEGYELEECEPPKDMQMVSVEPTFNPNVHVLHNYAMDYGDPWQNVRRTIYDGPNCGRCANRFRRTDWCDNHYCSTKPCYRFKLEK